MPLFHEIVLGVFSRNIGDTNNCLHVSNESKMLHHTSLDLMEKLFSLKSSINVIVSSLEFQNNNYLTKFFRIVPVFIFQIGESFSNLLYVDYKSLSNVYSLPIICFLVAFCLVACFKKQHLCHFLAIPSILSQNKSAIVFYVA